MKKVILILSLFLVISSAFAGTVGYTSYNDTSYPASNDAPSLTVTLSSDGNTLGLGFSSTDPKSTSGITNISEMPLTITPTLNAGGGNIQLIGSGFFYIWWQIQKPIESGKLYSFSVKKSGSLINGTKSVSYTATIKDSSDTSKGTIGETLTQLDTYTSYSESSIHQNSWKVEVVSGDAAGVPYGTVLTSTITLEVKVI